MDLTKLYPYVVPAGYLDVMPPEPEGFTLPLGHNTYVMLWEDHGNVAGNAKSEELIKAGLGAAEAHARAMENLQTLARGPEVARSGFAFEGTPAVLWCGNWLAASCIRLPGLWQWARTILITDGLCASIPQREALLIFPGRDKPFRDAMRNHIAEAEKDARKPITLEFFQLVADGIVPMIEEA